MWKATNNIQGNPHKVISLWGNSAGQRHDIFKVKKGKNLQQRILYPARLSFRLDREIKSFTDKQKKREFSTTKQALQQMLNELL